MEWYYYTQKYDEQVGHEFGAFLSFSLVFPGYPAFATLDILPYSSLFYDKVRQRIRGMNGLKVRLCLRETSGRAQGD
jgi:hypothetical protein